MVTRSASSSGIQPDSRLRQAMGLLHVVAVLAALMPLAGFTFGLTPIVIPFALLALVGVAGSRFPVAAWFAIIYIPIYHSLAFYSLIVDPLLGSLPIVLGTALWLTYIQAFLFITGYAPVAGAGATAVESLGPGLLQRMWVIRAGLFVAPAFALYLITLFSGWSPAVVPLIFCSVIAYGGYVYLRVTL